MSPKKKEIPNWVLIVAAIGVLALFSGAWIALPSILDDATDSTRRAEVLSALFGALAFGGVIGAIIMQKRELELQREELDETQQLMSQQASHLSRQAVVLRAQAFDTTFFELLRLHHELVRGVAVPLPNGRLAFGRDALASLANILLDQVSRAELPAHVIEPIGFIRHTYRMFYLDYGNQLGHLFRNLYHIVRYVDDSDLSAAEKYRYVRFVRAQLSSAELSLLFYNALAAEGEGFKPLIEQYALLKQLPEKPPMDSHRKLYHGNAFTAPRMRGESSAGEIAP